MNMTCNILHPDPSPAISDLKKEPPGITYRNGNNTQTYQIILLKNEISDHHQACLPKAFKKKTSRNQQTLNTILSTELLHPDENIFCRERVHKICAPLLHVIKYVYLNHSPPTTQTYLPNHQEPLFSKFPFNVLSPLEMLLPFQVNLLLHYTTLQFLNLVHIHS
jgi:hypothetical protein